MLFFDKNRDWPEFLAVVMAFPVDIFSGLFTTKIGEDASESYLFFVPSDPHACPVGFAHTVGGAHTQISRPPGPVFDDFLPLTRPLHEDRDAQAELKGYFNAAVKGDVRIVRSGREAQLQVLHTTGLRWKPYTVPLRRWGRRFEAVEYPYPPWGGGIQRSSEDDWQKGVEDIRKSRGHRR